MEPKPHSKPGFSEGIKLMPMVPDIKIRRRPQNKSSHVVTGPVDPPVIAMTERKRVGKANAHNLTSLSVRDAEVEIYRKRPTLMDFSVQPEISLKGDTSYTANQKATHDHLEPMLKALISIKE